MGKLILVRHGESVWNKKHIFTGWVDVSLSKKGIEEAISAGRLLSKITFDEIYTSELSRAQMTLQLIMMENQDGRTLYLGHPGDKAYEPAIKKDTISANVSKALNERCYGDFQGKSKDELKKEVGEEKFMQYRRSYATIPPGGESLKMTVDRTLPYFDREILPKVKDGKTVLIVAHGNSLRGIVKELMHISEEDIVKYEIETGKPLLFLYESKRFTIGAL